MPPPATSFTRDRSSYAAAVPPALGDQSFSPAATPQNNNAAHQFQAESPTDIDGHQPTTANKRRRVALACGTCRNRKSRCDGARPKCSMCCELDCECVYQQVGSSPNLTVGKDYAAQLEHRIEQIEDFIRPFREGRAEIPSVKPYAIHDQANPAQQHEPAEAMERRDTSKVPPQAVNPNDSEIGEIDNSENSIDGMAAINFADEEDSGFFGPSSNIAFMRHTSRAITQANSRNPNLLSVSPRDRHGNGMMSVSRSQPTTDGNTKTRSAHGVNMYALPSEAETWDLIQKYFSKTGQLLPFIHEHSFCETYFEMKRNNFTKVRRTWLGLLNIVFAISMSLSTDSRMPAEKRIEESDVYYQRANALCDRESKRNTSLEMVQYLLILGQYLQGTQKSVQAWTTHGLAVTASFQLGLHSPEANRGFSALEREIRKRTWFGCVLLDRTLSMTFGRPCIIPQSYVRLDMPLHDMQMLGSSQSGVGPYRDACFFTAAIQLYVVMYNVIDTCYGQNLGFDVSHTTFNVVSWVLEGDRQLEEWQHRLVPSLGLHVLQNPLVPGDVDIMKSDSVIFQRFNIVLSLRFHNLRILLHRKTLEKFLETAGTPDSTNPEMKILQQVGVSSVQNCVESAVVIISTVHTIASTSGWQRDLLGAWNYSLYYTFNAGLVIFGALLVSSRESSQNPALWETVERSRPYLDLAAAALRRLDSGNRVIERCVEYLSQLSLALAALTSNAFFFNNNNNTNTTMGSFSNGNGMVYPSAGLMSPSMSQTAATTTTTPSGGGGGGDGYLMNRSNQFPLSQSPVGIDLGEFMIDSDLDFLGKLFFDLSRNGDGGQVGGGGGGGPMATLNMAPPPPPPPPPPPLPPPSAPAAAAAAAGGGGGSVNHHSGRPHHPSNSYNV